MPSDTFKRTELGTAEELLEYLRPSGKHWSQRWVSQWIFRGIQDFDNWRLEPSSWRAEVREPFEHVEAELEPFLEEDAEKIRNYIYGAAGRSQWWRWFKYGESPKKRRKSTKQKKRN